MLIKAKNHTLHISCEEGCVVGGKEKGHTRGMTKKPSKITTSKKARNEREQAIKQLLQPTESVVVKEVKKKEVEDVSEARGVPFASREAEIRKIINELDNVIVIDVTKPLSHKDKLEYLKLKAELLDLKPKKAENHLHIHTVDVAELSYEQLLAKKQQLQIAQMSIVETEQ